MAVDNADPAGTGPATEPAGPAVLDPQHVGDIVGRLGTLKRGETGRPRSCRGRPRFLAGINASFAVHQDVTGHARNAPWARPDEFG